MAEWIALAELAVRPRPERAFARGRGGTADHAAFRARAARWRSALAAQPGERWAI